MNKTEQTPQKAAEPKQPEVKTITAGPDYKPRSYYHPKAKLDDAHLHAVIAHSQDQALHLESLGWQPSECFLEPQRRQEAVEASRQRAEEAKRAAQEAKRAQEVAEALAAQKAKAPQPTPAKIAETLEEFKIRAALARTRPLEERLRAIHERQISLCDAFTALRHTSWGPEHNARAKEGLALWEEECSIREELANG